MGTVKKIYCYLQNRWELLSLKKFTTLAGTLVFFLIMSITPFFFWLTLLIGRLPLTAEEVLSLPIFETVKDVFLFVQQEAATATAGASVILLFTTLYSATNLFYQMRRSGEIIYNFHQKKQGIRIRLGALILLFVVMIAIVVFLGIFAVGGVLFSRIFPKGLEIIADYLLLITISFFAVLLLNVYICPHRVKLKTFLPGTVVTVLLWVGAIIGFTLYLKFGNVTRLYGALSTIIVFLLWLYILMICFIIGVILNSESVDALHKKRGE